MSTMVLRSFIRTVRVQEISKKKNKKKVLLEFKCIFDFLVMCLVKRVGKTYSTIVLRGNRICEVVHKNVFVCKT